MPVTDILLRIVGAFYLFAGFLGLHAMSMDSLMDQVLAGITLKPTEPKEAVRRWMLTAGSFTVGLSGAALMVLSIWAVPLFLVAAALQLSWLVWARTNYVPEDALEARGRRQSTNAAIIYATMAATVTWLGLSRNLQHWTDHWALFIPAAALAIGAYAGRHLLEKPKSMSDWSAADDDDPDDRPIPPPPHRIRIEPKWGGSDIVDSDTGNAIAYFDYVPPDLADRIHAWTLVFCGGDDPEIREFWVEFASPAEESAHRTEGDAIGAALIDIFGQGNVTGPIYPADIRYQLD